MQMPVLRGYPSSPSGSFTFPGFHSTHANLFSPLGAADSFPFNEHCSVIWIANQTGQP
jgi:hypothetical protein